MWSTLSTAISNASDTISQAASDARKAVNDSGIVERASESLSNATQSAKSALRNVPVSIDTILEAASPALVSDEINLAYVTRRIIVMGLPASKPRRKRGENDIRSVAEYFRQAHKGRFMIWNLSEKRYDTKLFDEHVIEYRFPGYPAPPLKVLFQLCTSIESWLQADPKNVAVVHCATGRGRSAVAIASFLAWKGQAETPQRALRFFCKKRKTKPANLLIPSQARYLTYFESIVEGRRPRSEPLVFQRCIVHTVPDFETEREDDRCLRPFLQIFKDGVLLWCSHPDAATAQRESGKDETRLPRWARVEDDCVKFVPRIKMQGDVLIRCRHLREDGTQVSVFRAAFNTGYVQRNVLSLCKAELDGAIGNHRFSDVFRVELIFGAVVGDDEGGDPKDGAASSGLNRSFWDQVDKRQRMMRRRQRTKRAMTTPTKAKPLEKEARKPTNETPTTAIFGLGMGDAEGDVVEEDDLMLTEDEDDEVTEFDASQEVAAATKEETATRTTDDVAAVAAASPGTKKGGGLGRDRLAALEKELGLKEEKDVPTVSPPVHAGDMDRMRSSDSFNVDEELEKLKQLRPSSSSPTAATDGDESSSKPVGDDDADDEIDLDGMLAGLGDIDLGNVDDADLDPTSVGDPSEDLDNLEKYLEAFSTPTKD